MNAFLRLCTQSSGPTRARSVYRQSLRSLTEGVKTTIRDVDLADFPPEKIRNFSIVAHVDHGKSTLADRILETVGAIDVSSANKQVLDKLQVERERGITVKAQSVSVLYTFQGEQYILNLIDTPGHVDFSYEVTRSLRACQGVLLLVDANQGVQAQTVSNFYQAFANDLEIVPVINKIDLPNANPEAVREQLLSLFELDPGKVLQVSAKLGTGVIHLLDTVVERIPPPPAAKEKEEDLKLFLFDSWFDRYKGAINLVQVVSGTLQNQSQVVSAKTGKEYGIKSMGLMTPEPFECSSLYPGQVGYIIMNMRSAKEAVIGDTLHLKDKPVAPLLEISAARPMLFAGFYPFNPSEHRGLKQAIEKLCINDASVNVNVETSPALGSGWRLGFLGVLHMEVFSQRLEQEYEAEVLVTAPSVPYRLQVKETNRKKYGEFLEVSNPADWLTKQFVDEYQEPIVTATIITPTEYLSPILELCNQRRGEQVSILNIDQTRLNIQYIFPLNEVVTDFFDELKSRSSGYASFDYEDAGYRPGDLVHMEVLLNGNAVNELSCIIHASKAREQAKYLVNKLKDELPRQQFAIAVQAAVGGKILARGDLKALRKDVTAKCYGGDIGRKMKLLKNQAKGKKRLKQIGNIQISKDTFINILTNKRL